MSTEETIVIGIETSDVPATPIDLPDGLCPAPVAIVENQEFVYVNAEFCRLSGFTKHELIADVRLSDFCTIEDAQSMDFDVEALTKTGPLLRDLSVVTKGGENRFWKAIAAGVSYQLRPATLIVVTDITDWKQAVMARTESDQLYRILIDNTAEAIFVTDEAGECYLANPTACRMLDYSSEELLGSSVPALIMAEGSGGNALELWNSALEFKGTRSEVVFRHKDGRGIATLVGVTPLPNGQYLVGCHDITVSKALEEQLRQSQKMEAVGTLAGGVAHDFNNLLTGIIGYSEFLLQELDPRSAEYEDVLGIRRSADRAADLTRQLLAFSRRQILQPKVLDLNDVVGNIMKMLQRLVGGDIELDVKLDPDLGKVKVDPGQMEQVIMNLVVNAREAMPTGGSLVIETAGVQLDKDYIIEHPELDPGPYVTLAISDTGIGMDDETLGRIFEPFFTTKGQGTGLGLATVYGIVKQSGGSIQVHSRPGEGTMFRVYLPALQEATEEALEKTCAPRILVAESEDSVRELIRGTLETHGCEVTSCSSGQDAIAAVLEWGYPDLFIIGWRLSDMSGSDLAGVTQELARGIPIGLVFSSSEDSVLFDHDSNFDFVLTCPFRPSQLTDIVWATIQPILGDAPFSSRVDLGGTRIVVVDDDAEVVEVVAEVLERAGCSRVARATSAPEALLELENERFDLIVADWVMPDMDGVALAREVQRYFPETAVVLMSGHDTLEGAMEAGRTGAMDFVAKPIDPVTFVQTVHQAIQRARRDAPSRRARAREIRVSQQHIMRCLVSQGEVGEDQLSATWTRAEREEAFDLFVNEHPELAVDFSVELLGLKFGNLPRIQTFLTAWDQFVTGENRHGAESVATQCLCDALHFEASSVHTSERIDGYVVRAPTLRLKVPQEILVVYYNKGNFDQSDVIALHDFVRSKNLGIGRFVLTLVPGDVETLRDLLDQSTLIHDFVVLAKSECVHILGAGDPSRMFMDIVLKQLDLTVLSPFVVAGPVPQNMFFGREAEIKTVTRGLDRGSIALVGGRRIGKTSMLHKVRTDFARPNSHYTARYVNCQDTYDYDEFFRVLRADWDMPAAMSSTEPVEFRQLVRRMREKADHLLVVLLDETDGILQYDLAHSNRLFRTLRALSEEGDCRFIFSGERVLDAQMRNPSSPLFNFCTKLKLGYLDSQSAINLILEPMDLMNIKLVEQQSILDIITRSSSCHPHVVQLIGHQLVQQLAKDGSRELSPRHVETVVESAYFRHDFIRTIWGQATPLERMLTLLMVDHGSPLTMNEFLGSLDDQEVGVDQCEVETALGNLCLYNVLDRNPDGRYSFIPLSFPSIIQETMDIIETIASIRREIHDGRESLSDERSHP